MENEELKKILNNLRIPEPAEEAKNKAVQSAMAEFRLQAEKRKKQLKGFTWLDRLISKRPRGGYFMNRSIAVTAGTLAIFVIAFAVVFSPEMISQRTRISAPDKAS
jgi:hypothetical protein